MHSNDNYENKKQATETTETETGCRQQEDKHNPSTGNEVATTITAHSSLIDEDTQFQSFPELKLAIRLRALPGNNTKKL